MRKALLLKEFIDGNFCTLGLEYLALRMKSELKSIDKHVIFGLLVTDKCGSCVYVSLLINNDLF